jgi:hypothetical protein
MSMQALLIARAVAFALFGVATLVMVKYSTGFAAILVPAVLLIAGNVFNFMIHSRKGTIAKRMALLDSSRSETWKTK